MWSVTVSSHVVRTGFHAGRSRKEPLNEGLTYFVHEMCFLRVNTGSSAIAFHL